MKSTALALLALLPLPAAAQSFEGASIELQYQHYNDGGGFTIDTAEGYAAAAWDFGALGTQVSLGYAAEVNSSLDINFQQVRSAALHLTTDVSDKLRLGALSAFDLDGGAIYLYAAEALYLDGPLRLEARLGSSFDKNDPILEAELLGSYDLNPALKLRAGILTLDHDTYGFYYNARVGIGYDINDSTEIYADFARHAINFGTGDPTSTGTLSYVGIRFDLGQKGENRLFNLQSRY